VRPEELGSSTRDLKFTISFRAEKWDELHRFARATADDGLETGGFLFGGHVRSWHSRVSVARVTSMVRARAEASVKLDVEALVREKASIRASGQDGHFGEIGSWHTHPDQSGRPSDADMDHWLNGCDFLERPYIGLILTAHPSDERWNRPDTHGWIVWRDAERERAKCERAIVEIDGVPRRARRTGA
jgi:proteasome lid subunit RPN8/RPN11